MTDLIIYQEQTVDFYGDKLAAIQTDRGIYVPVKPICDILGIDWESQRQRIYRDEILSSVTCVIQATGADKKRYEMVCLPDDMLHGWLFGVDLNRIAPENREHLLRYKRECYRVLHHAFTQLPTVDPAALAALSSKVDALAVELSMLKATPIRPAPRRYHDILPIDDILHIFIVTQRPLTAADVTRALAHVRSLGPRQVGVRMRRLAACGKLRKLDSGLYVLPEERNDD